MAPRTLNPVGWTILEDMKGQEFLEKNKEALFNIIDSKHPKAALDVEIAAKIACVSVINEDFFIPIKTYIFNCPLIDAGEGKDPIDMDLGVACFVLSVPLRDMYLKEHPNLV